MSTQRDSCEAAFKCLMGQTIGSVIYMGAWTTAPSESGAYIEWVELATSDDARFRVTTEPDFGDFGLVLLEGAVDRSDALKVFDATGLSPWKGVARQRVVNVEVRWRPLSYLGGAMPGEPPEYPRDVLLTFENRRLVVLSASAVGQDGEVLLGVDSVGVYGEDEARSLGLL